MFRPVVFLLALWAATALHAQPQSQAPDPAYPSKVVRLIIAFGPGTGGDFLARLVAERLSIQTQGRFIVENRPGAGGATGTQAAADAAPDGYTLLLGSNATLIVNPTVNKNTGYDGATAFVPIGTIARTSMLLVCANREDAPRSLAALIDKAKAGPVSYASTGVGAFGHLTAEILMRRTGIKATHVPYKSSSESLTDVSRGEVLLPRIRWWRRCRISGAADCGRWQSPVRVGSRPCPRYPHSRRLGCPAWEFRSGIA